MTKEEFEKTCDKVQSREKVNVKVILQSGKQKKGRVTGFNRFLDQLSVKGLSAPIHFGQAELI